MLSYRHAFHAGNHADVLKHCLLVAVLRHLCRKETPWWFIDSHAGAGVYALDSPYARKNAEFADGIGRLWERRDLPAALADYLDLVRLLNPDGVLRHYPGSPWFARQLMRPRDQLRLFELHGSDVDILRVQFAGSGRRVRVEATDGLDGLKSLLPPPSRRGLVLIDPSYEVKTDYARVPAALADGLKRFAAGTFAVWYPRLSRLEAERLPDRLIRPPTVRHWLRAELSVRAPGGRGMAGSGVVVINPPWTLGAQLREALPVLRDLLGQPGAASFVLEEEERP